MKIYVACLAAYNAGRLHGAWIDATSDADAMAADVNAMLAASPVPGAEEYAVHDYDGFPDMGEFPGFDAIAETAGLVELAEEHGINADDFSRIASNWHGRADDIRGAFDKFLGVYDDFRDYADELADSIMCELSGPAREFASQYFDYASHAVDVEHGCTVIELLDGVAVFYD